MIKNIFSYSATEISCFEYCPRRHFLSKTREGFESFSMVKGGMEHDLNRLIVPKLKKGYELRDSSEFLEFAYSVIDEGVLYVRRIALHRYPQFSKEIEEFIPTLTYRFRQHEEKRVAEILNLSSNEYTIPETLKQLLPMEVEMTLYSKDLGLKGRIDEVYQDGDAKVPVDIKGTLDGFIHQNEYHIQLAVYGILLKDQLNTPVKKGKIYYSRTASYDEVIIDDALVSKVFQIKKAIEHQNGLEELPPRLEGNSKIKCSFCYSRKQCYEETGNGPSEVQDINSLKQLFTSPPGKLNLFGDGA